LLETLFLAGNLHRSGLVGLPPGLFLVGWYRLHWMGGAEAGIEEGRQSGHVLADGDFHQGQDHRRDVQYATEHREIIARQCGGRLGAREFEDSLTGGDDDSRLGSHVVTRLDIPRNRMGVEGHGLVEGPHPVIRHQEYARALWREGTQTADHAIDVLVVVFDDVT